MATTQRTPKKRPIRSFFHKLYSLWQNSFLVSYFTNYQAFDMAMNQNRFHRTATKFSSMSIWKWTQRKIQTNAERSRTIHAIDSAMTTLLHLPLKTYGMFFLSFGLYLASMCYILPNTYMQQSNFSNLIIAIAAVLIAFILLTSKKSLASAVWESKIFSFFFFSLLGVRSNTVEEGRPVNGSDAIAFLLGMAFGVLTFIVPATSLLGAILLFVLAYLVLLTPESGLVLLLLAAPFLNDIGLIACLLYVLFAYVLKLLQSRRMLHIRGIDYTVLFFIIYLAIFGSVSAYPTSSVPNALFFAGLAVGYFLVISLVKTAIWLRRCVFALTFSSFLIAMIGIVEYFFGDLNAILQLRSLFTSVRGNALATFPSSVALAQYLILLIPITLSMMILQIKGKRRLVLSFPLLIALVACLVCTWSRGAWLALLLAMAFFCLFSGKLPRRIFLTLAVIVAIIWRWLPKVFTGKIFEIFHLSIASNTDHIRIWTSSWNLLKSVWYSGIGWGEDVFVRYYAQFGPQEALSAPHAHQLFLHLTISIGIIGLLAFLYILLLLVRYFTTLRSQLKEAKDATTYYYSLAFLCSIFALLFCGLTDYVFAQGRIFFLFFVICGLLITSGRTYYKERNLAKDDLMSIDLPYREEGSADAKKVSVSNR